MKTNRYQKVLTYLHKKVSFSYSKELPVLLLQLSQCFENIDSTDHPKDNATDNKAQEVNSQQDADFGDVSLNVGNGSVKLPNAQFDVS